MQFRNTSNRQSSSTPSGETRRKLGEAAHQLFKEHGFDNVTVDQIAERAGLSRRTFFRYFPTKESVVFPNDNDQMRHFRHALLHESGGRPATMAHLQAVLDQLADFYIANAEKIGERRLIIDKSVALVAYEQMIFMEWRQAIAEGIDGIVLDVQQGRVDDPSEAALVIAGAIVGALVPTFWAWYQEGREGDLKARAHQVLERLEGGFGPSLVQDKPVNKGGNGRAG